MKHHNGDIALNDLGCSSMTMSIMPNCVSVLHLSSFCDIVVEKAFEELVLRDCNLLKKDPTKFIAHITLARLLTKRRIESRDA